MVGWWACPALLFRKPSRARPGKADAIREAKNNASLSEAEQRCKQGSKARQGKACKARQSYKHEQGTQQKAEPTNASSKRCKRSSDASLKGRKRKEKKEENQKARVKKLNKLSA